MKTVKVFNSISFLIQVDQGYSNIYYLKIKINSLTVSDIIYSLNTLVTYLRERNINPIKIEIYTGELIQEELIFKVIC